MANVYVKKISDFANLNVDLDIFLIEFKKSASDKSVCKSLDKKILILEISFGKKLVACINTERPEKPSEKAVSENDTARGKTFEPDISIAAFPISKKGEISIVKAAFLVIA